MKRHIPNILTLLNLAAGFAAIIFLGAGKLNIVVVLVLIAMVFDFADGFAARLLKAYSPLGKELDSLADMVTFGVVPGLIAFDLIKASIVPGGFIPLWLPYASVIIPLFSALRLAKFNIDTEQTYFFRGLPTPANAIMIISIGAIAVWDHSPAAQWILSTPWILLMVVITSSTLMITRLPLLSLKIKEFTLKANRARIVLIILSILAVSLLGIKGTMLVIPLYVAISLIMGAE